MAHSNLAVYIKVEGKVALHGVQQTCMHKMQAVDLGHYVVVLGNTL